MTFSHRIASFLVFGLILAMSAFGQTTASLTGDVTTEGKGLPGVTVTISSPNLQGTRTAVTGNNGNFRFPSVPPSPARQRPAGA